MARTLSVDLRERVVAAVDCGLSRRKAAERFGVSISSAIRWTSLRRRTGDVRPKRQGGDKAVGADRGARARDIRCLGTVRRPSDPGYDYLRLDDRRLGGLAPLPLCRQAWDQSGFGRLPLRLICGILACFLRDELGRRPKLR